MNYFSFFPMPIKLCFLILFPILFCGCEDSDSGSNTTIITLNETLVKSSALIDEKNKSIIHALSDKLKDPVTKERAEIWNPKAEKASSATKSLCEFINNFRTQFELETGIRIKAGKKIYENLDENISNKFYEKGFYKELEHRLLTFKDSIITIDSELTKLFYEYMPQDIIIDTTRQTNIYDYYFKNKSPLAIIGTLSAFENDAKRIESFALDYCFRKCPTGDDFFDETFYALASQSSTYVQKGDKIEITAGVLAFSLKAQPNITINNKHVDINVDGVAVYKFKSSSKPGKHYIPVSIEFKKPDGQNIIMQKTIEYTVAE